MTHKESSWDILTAFGADLRELNKVRDKLGDSPFVARVFVRTIFSIFDGYAWYLKQRALEGAATAGVEFTPQELEIIHEERVKTLQSGETKTVPSIVQTKENLKFAIRAYARVRRTEAPLPNNALPAEFHAVSDVRNRITHPKSAADFDISKAEANALGRLLEWFMGLIAWADQGEQDNISEAKARAAEMLAEATRNHPPPQRK